MNKNNNEATPPLSLLDEKKRAEYERLVKHFPALDADDIRKLVVCLDEFIVPVGTVGLVRNRLLNVWYELTSDENDPLLNKPERAFLPAEHQDKLQANEGEPAAESKKDAQILNALAFSHVTSSRAEFEAIACKFERTQKLNNVMDGIMFDARTLDAMQGLERTFQMDAAGNVVCAVLTPLGWSEAMRKRQVCTRCGHFPSYNRCYDCNSATFCSDECLLRSKRDEIHSPVVCEQFVRKKVEAVNPIMVQKDEK